MWGVDVTITHEALTDLEYLVDMSVLEDEAVTEIERGRACLRVMRHLWPGVCHGGVHPVRGAPPPGRGPQENR